VRLSLRSKLVGGFGLLLLLIAVLGWVTLLLFDSLRGVQSGVLERAIPELVTVDEIVRSYTAQSAAARGYVISSRPTLLDQYRREASNVRRWEKRAGELLSDAEQHRLNDLVHAGHAFQRVVENRVFPLAEKGKRSQAFRVLTGQGADRTERVEALGQAMRTTQLELVERSEAELTERSNQAVVLLVAVIVAALALGILVAVALPRRLVRNLARLVDAARAVGRGDFDHPVDVQSGDEVEELAHRFKEMQAGLKRLQQLALQDRELEIAASIQQRLLQGSIPKPQGLVITPMQRQANLVGGDWYDVDVIDRKATIAIGDASGKGIAAALMATVALSFLRAERSLGSGGRRVVERVNEALYGATDSDSFSTLIYFTVDSMTGDGRWLNMGHPSPFILKRVGSRVSGYFVEGPRNRALGWFEDPGLEETTVALDPGDRIVLFTDGWLEARSAGGEIFGEQRFGEALLRLADLSPLALGRRLVEEVERFAAGRLEDDLTMLVVERQATAAAGAGRERTGEDAWHSRR
jgi:serine phosphatase RsbU (regulator of sigma subunit)/CHASE3 domain sensor protein